MANTFAPNGIDGQLPSSKGTLYTTPASTSAYVRSMTFVNTNAATQTITIYKKSTTSRAIAVFTLAQNERLYLDEPMVLETGDLIEAVTTTAAAVDYTISLVEES
jgi:hypothetical protein